MGETHGVEKKEEEVVPIIDEDLLVELRSRDPTDLLRDKQREKSVGSSTSRSE